MQNVLNAACGIHQCHKGKDNLCMYFIGSLTTHWKVLQCLNERIIINKSSLLILGLQVTFIIIAMLVAIDKKNSGFASLTQAMPFSPDF